MNSSAVRLPVADNIKFSAIAGALAGFLIGAGIGVLQALVWGSKSLLEQKYAWDLLELSLRTTTTTVFLLTGAGLGGGIIWGVLLPRISPQIKRLSRQLLFAAWVLVSFVWSVWSMWGNVPAVPDLGLELTEATFALVVTVALYRLWCILLRWIRQGRTGRSAMAIAVVGIALWIPFGAYLFLRP